MNHSCKAMEDAENILNYRGTSPRTYRNTLMFIAPDYTLLNGLRDGVRNYLAWKSVKEDCVDLNLDASQNRETENNLQRSNQTVDARIKETYCWLLVPYIDRDVDLRIPMARNNEKNVAGIVLNAFTEPFVLDAEIFDMVENMKTRLENK